MPLCFFAHVHDPYAEQEDATATSYPDADAEKTRGMLELSRHKKTKGSSSDEGNKPSANKFARNMFLALKAGKMQRSDR